MVIQAPKQSKVQQWAQAKTFWRRWLLKGFNLRKNLVLFPARLKVSWLIANHSIRNSTSTLPLIAIGFALLLQSRPSTPSILSTRINSLELPSPQLSDRIVQDKFSPMDKKWCPRSNWNRRIRHLLGLWLPNVNKIWTRCSYKVCNRGKHRYLWPGRLYVLTLQRMFHQKCSFYREPRQTQDRATRTRQLTVKVTPLACQDLPRMWRKQRTLSTRCSTSQTPTRPNTIRLLFWLLSSPLKNFPPRTALTLITLITLMEVRTGLFLSINAVLWLLNLQIDSHMPNCLFLNKFSWRITSFDKYRRIGVAET